MKRKKQQNDLRSTAAAAQELGIKRDSLQWAMRMGAPEPAQRVAGRRAFTQKDIELVRVWLAGRSMPRVAKGGTNE
ncbi:MAG: hypothetical protein WCT04_12455 [Planctomycetota bacterium]